MKKENVAKCTPGPWRVHEWTGARGETFVQVQGAPEDQGGFDAMSGRPMGAQRATVARCGTIKDDSARADAALIAAAPDLLEAAKAALAWRLNGEGKNKPDAIYLNDILRAAIAKAKAAK